MKAPDFNSSGGRELLPNAVSGLEAGGAGVARLLPRPSRRRRQLRGEPGERTCVLPLAVRPRLEHPPTGAGTVRAPVERMPPGGELHRRAADPGASEITGGCHLRLHGRAMASSCSRWCGTSRRRFGSGGASSRWMEPAPGSPGSTTSRASAGCCTGFPRWRPPSRCWSSRARRTWRAWSRLGFVATCNPGGACNHAGKWLKNYTESLEGKRVVILPDNDTPGQKHADIVVQAIRHRVRELRIVQVPVGQGRIGLDCGRRHAGDHRPSHLPRHRSSPARTFPTTAARRARSRDRVRRWRRRQFPRSRSTIARFARSARTVSTR